LNKTETERAVAPGQLSDSRLLIEVDPALTAPGSVRVIALRGVDWNMSGIIPFIQVQRKMRALCGLLRPEVCATSDIEHKNMLAIRLYISALTLIFLFLVITHRGLGLLEGIVITCAVVYLILDVRTELQSLKLEFRLLQELEQYISELRRQIP